MWHYACYEQDYGDGPVSLTQNGMSAEKSSHCLICTTLPPAWSSHLICIYAQRLSINIPEIKCCLVVHNTLKKTKIKAREKRTNYFCH